MIGQIQSYFLNIKPARETFRPRLVDAQVIWAWCCGVSARRRRKKFSGFMSLVLSTSFSHAVFPTAT